MHSQNKKIRRAVLTGTILPSVLVISASAATWNGTPVTLDNNPVYAEGLREGYTNTNNDFTTAIGSANIGPNLGVSLNLRMGQSTTTDAQSGAGTAWADNRTWIYAGEMFTGPNGVISIAANNDDTDYFKLDGSVVLSDTAWNVPNSTVVRGLTPNTWVPFEYRVANGNGGAGPSGQNTNGGSGWTSTIGVVMSYDDEGGSVVVGNYSGGNGLGQPAETAGGGPTLFRYQDSGGITPENISLTSSTTVTMTGNGLQVAENILSVPALSPTSLTLTVNNGDASQHTLGFSVTGTSWISGSTLTFAGTASVRIGQTQDGANTGAFIVRNGGSGELIFDNASNDLNGTTLQVVDGRVSIKGNGFNPVSTLATPIEVNGVNAKLRFGALGFDSTRTTFGNAINFNDSGTLEHASDRLDVLSGNISIASGKTLNTNITGGTLLVSGATAGLGTTETITKTGNGTMVFQGTTTVSSASVSAGRLAFKGATTLTSPPIINSGGTLAITGIGVTNSIAGPIAVPTGGKLEVAPGAIGTVQTSLTGGTLVLDGEHGLLGEFWNATPNSTASSDNTGNYNATWAPTTSNLVQGSGTNAGVNTAGNGDFTAFQNSFAGLGGAGFTVNSAANEIPEINYPTTTGAPYDVYGVPYTDNIQARWTGKFYAAVAGVYQIATVSDDGSALFIDGASVVNNNRYQGMTNRGGTVFLQPGLHDIVFGMYEGGGGAGLQVLVTPPGGASAFLSNSLLFPNATPSSFANPINVQQDSTIQTTYFSAIAADVTVQSTKTVTTTGNDLTVSNLKLPTAGGTYTINTSGALNSLTASVLTDSGNAVTINKTGAGLFALDNTTTPQLSNAGSVINIQQGTLGILLQTGGLSPTGNAAINFQGGGIALSSKGGNQTYPLPAVFGGNSPVVEARKIGTGVAGPVTVTLGGNLNIPSTQTLGLKTADNYTMEVGGTANLGGGVGTVSINGGRINTTTAGAMNGLNIAFGTTVGTTGTLNLRTAAPSIASLSGGASGVANLSLGDGTANSVLTIDQSTNTTFAGNITQEGTSIASVIKKGTGTLQLTGTAHTYSGGLTIEAGTVAMNGFGLGSGPLTLNGGTLAALPSGLLGEYWDSSVGGDGGAQAGFGGDLGNFNSYFLGKGAATVSTPTTTNGRIDLKFSSGTGLDGGGPDTATFGDQGFTATNNMAVRLSGTIFAPAAGDYTFTTRSDDGSVLFVDGTKVVDNNNYQGMTNRSGTITLTAGNHTISVGFYEGGGGSGLEVRYTPPGGVDQFIPNSVLGGLHGLNAVNLIASSTIDPAGGAVDLGAMTTSSGKILTGLAGDVRFSSSALTNAGTYEFNKSGAGVMSLGAVNAAAQPVTIKKSGDGSLLFGIPTAAQLQTAGNVIQVTGGRVIAVAGNTLNPLGNSAVQLSNGGGLAFSSADPTATFGNTITVNGAVTISAANFGNGAVDNVTVTVSSPLNIPSATASLTLNTANGYQLNLDTVNGGGNVTVTGGTINTNAGITVGAIVVNGTPTGTNTYGTLLNTTDTVTATSATVQAGGVLRQAGAFTTTSGGTTVEANGEFDVNGSAGTLGTTVTLNGGILRAQAGITDFGGNPINAAPRTTTANTLRGVAHLTSGEFVASVLAPNNEGQLLTSLLKKPDAAISLTGPLGITNNAQADAAFATLFGLPALVGQRFTTVFTGTFTAATTGLYNFQAGTVDDIGAFWVDLNNNGIFEGNGSAGSELISSQGCCGEGPIGSATLYAGKTYNVAFGVEDTGGDSGFTARFQRPTDAAMLVVNPGDAAQAGLWATNNIATGGAIIVENGAELRAARANNASVIALTGNNAKLRLSSSTTANDSVGSLTALVGAPATPVSSTIELGSNNTLTVENLSVGPEATLIKTGAGTLIATAQSLGSRVDPLVPALQIDAGAVILNGLNTAFNGGAQGTANGGNVVVNNGGTLTVNGGISGAVLVNVGGKLAGSGTVGATTVNGILAPGNSAGTLTTGALSLTSTATIQFELGVPNKDLVTVNGDLTLDGLLQIIVTGGLVDGTYRIMDYTGVLTDNTLDLDSAFTSLFPGSHLDLATANQVNLVVVPEPGAIAALLGGAGMLAGLRRFRRLRP